MRLFMDWMTKLVSAATRLFGAVHSLVCTPYHDVGIDSILGINTDANAQGYLEFVPGNNVWCNEFGQHFFGYMGSIRPRFNFGQ